MGKKRNKLSVEHPYPCAVESWFENDKQKWSSWDAFEKHRGDDDVDLNLIVRWDWRKWRTEDGKNVLLIVMLMQRKGYVNYSGLKARGLHLGSAEVPDEESRYSLRQHLTR
jgi:hypothetical protein